MENINQQDIHEIISQISHTLNCPHCKARVLPHNIKITDMVANQCLFDVKCHKCKTEMSLSANIEKTNNGNSQTYNKSSQIMHNNYIEEGITEADITDIKKELRNFGGSFIEAFAK